MNKIMSLGNISNKIISTLNFLLIILFACIIGIGYPILANDTFLILIQIVGLSLVIWSLWTIKFENFELSTKTNKDKRIIGIGPFRHVRHPIYTSLLMFTLPLIINYFSILRLGIWVALLILVILKIHHNEIELRRHLNDYSIYKQSSRKLMPFIF